MCNDMRCEQHLVILQMSFPPSPHNSGGHTDPLCPFKCLVFAIKYLMYFPGGFPETLWLFKSLPHQLTDSCNSTIRAICLLSGNSLRRLYQFRRAAVLKYHKFNNRNLFSHSSGGWNSEIKVSAGPCSL